MKFVINIKIEEKYLFKEQHFRQTVCKMIQKDFQNHQEMVHI